MQLAFMGGVEMTLFILLWLAAGFVLGCIILIGAMKPVTVKDVCVLFSLSMLGPISLILVAGFLISENQDRVLFDPCKWRKK